MIDDVRNRVEATFSTWTSGMLSIALLAAAAVLVFIALQPGHEALKALALAYVVLP